MPYTEIFRAPKTLPAGIPAGCTGNWGILAWGEGQLEEVPIGVSASFGKCQLGDFNLSDFLGTILILIYFYLINATIEHYSLSKIYSINNNL